MFNLKQKYIGGLGYHIKLRRTIRTAGMSASFALFIMAALASFPIVPHTDVVEALAPVASDTEIAMVVGKSSARLSLSPKDMNGSFSASTDLERAEFNITTNNYTGYTLTIVGNDDNGTLNNTNPAITSNNTLSSITAMTDATTFNSSSALNGKWGYLPSKYNSEANTAFRPSPTTAGSTIDVTSAANTTANDYTIALGARVDYSKPAGQYTNTFILTAVGNPVGYSVSYSDNTSDTSVANLPATDSGSTNLTSIKVSNTIPTRTGYTFRSWCTEQTTNNGTTCGGTEYTSGSTLDFIDQTKATNSLTLYATWTVATYLQTVQVRYQNTTGGWGDYSTYAPCTTEAGYGTRYYCDIPATAEYQAASLAGYSVYGTNTKQIDVYRNLMSVNLTKGTGVSTVRVSGSGVESGSGSASAAVYYGGDITIAATIPSGYDWVNWTGTATYNNQEQNISNVTSDLNLTANGKSWVYFQDFTYADCGKIMHDNRASTAYKSIEYTTAKIGHYCWMTRNLDLPGGTTLTSEDSNVTSSYTLPTSSDSGFDDDIKAFVYNSDNTHCDPWYTTGSFNPCYSYYSYMAATAGTGADTPRDEPAPSDICPKGWRLPTIEDFNTLISSYSDGPALNAAPFQGVYGGSFSSTGYQGGNINNIDSFYWSSTNFVNSSTSGSARGLRYRSYAGSASTGAYTRYQLGGSVRCLVGPYFD